MAYTSEGVYHGGVSGLGNFARLVRYRDCLLLLSARALKVRYRRSVLGFAWTLLYPLIAMAVLSVVFARVFSDLPHYPLYVIVGVLAWGFFSLSCLQAMDALLGGGAVLRKVYVPSAIFPLAVIGANFVNLLLSIAVLPVVMLALGAHPGVHPALLIVALVALAAFTVGVALTLAALNLFFHDIRYFFEALLLVWFYASPVVYPVSVIPAELRAFLWLNPFYWFLELLRASLYSGEPPPSSTVLIAAAFASVSLAVGWLVYNRLQHRFYLYL